MRNVIIASEVWDKIADWHFAEMSSITFAPVIEKLLAGPLSNNS